MARRGTATPTPHTAPGSTAEPRAQARNKAGGMTVGGLLRVAATRFRDREMLYCATTERRFSFRETNDRTNRLANGLTQLGISKGDTVAFVCNNRAEIVETYFALAKIGAVGMPLNYRLAPVDMADLVTMSHARALIFAPAFAETIGTVREQTPSVGTFIAIGETVPDFAIGYEEIVNTSSAREPQVEVDEDDPHYFNLTSGTTGSPKMYLLDHRRNAIGGILMGNQMDMTVEDVVLTVFPMFGRVGFGWSLMSVLMGAKNVLLDFDPATVLKVISTEACTITNLVPTMAVMLLGTPNFQDHDLRSLRGIVFAGAPLPSHVHRVTVESLCPNIYEYYGMQETGVCTDIKPDAKRLKPDSVGQVSAFCEVRILGPDGGELPANESGAIVVRTPTSTTQYFQSPIKTQETFRDGWIHTGDLGRFDDDGFLFVTGRAKEVIVTGGQNVFATEVEDVLLAHPEVADCSVIGLPDDFWGEAVTAVIVRRTDSTVTEAEVIEHCKKTLAGFKSPKKVLWRDQPIPRTPTGKVTKYVLLEEYTHAD